MSCFELLYPTSSRGCYVSFVDDMIIDTDQSNNSGGDICTMQQEDFDTLIKLYVIINCKPISNAYRQHLITSGAFSSRIGVSLICSLTRFIQYVVS